MKRREFIAGLGSAAAYPLAARAQQPAPVVGFFDGGSADGSARFVTAFPPELDIVVFAPRASSVGECSELSRRIFNAAARRNLHLAVAELPVKLFAANLGDARQDRSTITCLRSVLMKPEHLAWIGRIWEILDQATDECMARQAGIGN